ncbi:AMP-binding protein [Rhodococcus sp. ADH]|nr:MULTISPECIES: AMP-binding protein [unclassified Rhodococcus (in: high G+C Gram-positive bacteria)]
MFDQGWSWNPQGVAFEQNGHVTTYDAAGRLSCQVAHALLAEGISTGTKCAVWAENDSTAWVCTLGIWRANACWIPVGVRNTTESNSSMLDKFDCEVIFYQSTFAPQILALAGSLPQITTWICIDGPPARTGTPGWTTLAEFVNDAPSTRPNLTVDMNDPAMLSQTGGTTGISKGVVNTHRSLKAFCANFMYATPYPRGTFPVNLAAAPMTHTAGVLSLPTSARGGIVVISTASNAADLIATVRDRGITELFLPPTVIYRMMDAAQPEALRGHRLRYLIYGAAPIATRRLREALDFFGPCLMGGYGQTEAPASISFLLPDQHYADGTVASDKRLQTVGRPSPLVSVTVQDGDGRILDTGQTGELCVRGDLVMHGYYNDDTETARAFRNGWLRTGDIGHIDSDGFISITDRHKDMIITGGFNVYPSEVEQTLWAHPAVKECAVVGVPDPVWGELVTAAVELRSGADTTPEQLIAFCKGRLGSVKAPKSIFFLNQLPRSPIGKVLKRTLRDDLSRR